LGSKYREIGGACFNDRPREDDISRPQPWRRRPPEPLPAFERGVAASAGPNQSSGVEGKVVFVFNFADYLSTIAPLSQ